MFVSDFEFQISDLELAAMQFRLSTLFWITLVFATSMGLAGVWGVPCAIYWIALLWAAARPTAVCGSTTLPLSSCVLWISLSVSSSVMLAGAI